MRFPRVRFTVRRMMVAVAIFAVIPAAYRAGYQSGLSGKIRPQYRALAVVRRDGQGFTTSYTWYDITRPLDAARLRTDEAHQKAVGAEYYIANGWISINASGPSPARQGNPLR
jgi:hypothetical protein